MENSLGVGVKPLTHLHCFSASKRALKGQGSLLFSLHVFFHIFIALLLETPWNPWNCDNTWGFKNLLEIGEEII